MNTLTHINAWLPLEAQHELLKQAALAALARYSCMSDAVANFQEVLAWERSGELTLRDRLWDCLPEEGCSWLQDELWDFRESLFEVAWGDTGEELLSAIIGPEKFDEDRAVELHDAIEHRYQIGEGIPAYSNRVAPTIPILVDFIRAWRINLLNRLARQIPLTPASLGGSQSECFTSPR